MSDTRKPRKAGYQVPFTEDGSIPHWTSHTPEYTGYGDPVVWRDPEPFYGLLQVDDFTWGRSSVTVVLKNLHTGATYHMRATEFRDLLKQPVWEGPLLMDGLWQPIKRGQNYFVSKVEA